MKRKPKQHCVIALINRSDNSLGPTTSWVSCRRNRAIEGDEDERDAVHLAYRTEGTAPNSCDCHDWKSFATTSVVRVAGKKRRSEGYRRSIRLESNGLIAVGIYVTSAQSPSATTAESLVRKRVEQERRRELPRRRTLHDGVANPLSET